VYLERANAMAVNYRDNYLVGANYNNSAHWSQLTGVALHYLATGDEASRRAVGYATEWLSSNNYYWSLLGGNSSNRVRARVLGGAVLAAIVDAPQGGPASQNIAVWPGSWKEKAAEALNRILSAQSPDGAWRDAEHCSFAKPFMDALLTDVLILYYQRIERDPRIPQAIQRTLDYNWANSWLPADQSFKYLEGPCAEGTGPSPDLNLFQVHSFGWMYAHSGNKTYRDRAEQIFAGGVGRSYLQGSKQFNQAYASSFRYFMFR
jgi:hypothetical protein